MTVELLSDDSTRETFRWVQECIERDGRVGSREETPGVAAWIKVEQNKSNEGDVFINGGDPIPKPIPEWYSVIGDIVGASQHALDFLIMHAGQENEGKSAGTKKLGTRKGSARRGPKVVRDLKADRKLVGDWKAAKNNGQSRDQFCWNKSIKVKDLEDAQRNVGRK